LRLIAPERLRHLPFFAFMDERQLNAVARIADEVHIDAGDEICKAHTPSETLNFLIQGSLLYYMVVVSPYQPDYRKEYFIGVVNPGEIFGISSLLEPHLHTATLRADKAGYLIRINGAALRDLCDENADLAAGLMKAVAKTAMNRLEMTRIQLVAQMVDRTKELAV
jgi:CRP-like cAMP-binding protein